MKMKNKWRIVAGIVATATVCATLVGSNSAATAAPKPGSVKLGIAYWDTRTYAFQLMVKGAKAVAASDKAIDLKSAAPAAGDPSKLLPLFQAMAQTQTNGVVLQTLAADPFYRPVLDTTNKGVPVIAIDAPPPANAGVSLFITNNNPALGASLAAEVLKSIPASATGEVVIGTNGPSVPPLQARVSGMTDWIKANRPNLTVVGPISTEGTSGTPAENYDAWNGIWQQHKNAVAYLAPGAQDAVSLALLEDKQGVKLNIGGMDLEPGAVSALKAGKITALVSPEHWLKGYIATKLLATHAEKGKSIPSGTWDTGGLVVNKTNIAAIAKRQSSDAAMLKALGPVGDKQIAQSSKYITK